MPDVILDCADELIACSARTIYRQFKDGIFDVTTLPLKEKRKPNGHQERHGKQIFKRNIAEREMDYPTFKKEFGHIEGDTIVGIHHKSAVITLVERLLKIIFTLKPNGRKAKDIEITMNQWFRSIPRNLFKSITFDCGKDFSNWKTLCNLHDIAIYFADPGMPSQHGLNENSNSLLRKDGLPKEMNFNLVDQAFISSIAHKINKIRRKYLNYQTSLEILSKYVNESDVSSLY